MSERVQVQVLPRETRSGPRILFVVDAHARQPAGAGDPDRYGPDIAVRELAGISRPFLEEFAPHFVVSPLFAAGFDIMDVARRLSQLGFRGGYRAVAASPLPDPALVLAEVRAACPGLDVDILAAAALRPGGRDG
jgi:hypothetical protein